MCIRTDFLCTRCGQRYTKIKPCSRVAGRSGSCTNHGTTHSVQDVTATHCRPKVGGTSQHIVSQGASAKKQDFPPSAGGSRHSSSHHSGSQRGSVAGQVSPPLAQGGSDSRHSDSRHGGSQRSSSHHINSQRASAMNKGPAPSQQIQPRQSGSRGQPVPTVRSGATGPSTGYSHSHPHSRGTGRVHGSDIVQLAPGIFLRQRHGEGYRNRIFYQHDS